jgi:Zn-dependent protease
MSLAGPLANLALALAAWSLMALGLRTGVFVPGLFAGVNALVAPAHSGAVGSIAATVVDVMFRLNLVLFVFNLIPLPPMDGSEVWYLFIGREEERFRWKRLFASYSLIGILVAWRLFPRLFEPVFLAFLNALYRFAG